MTDFADKLSLRGMAEEDIYFARHDRELVRALHEKGLREARARARTRGGGAPAGVSGRRFDNVAASRNQGPGPLARAYRKLLDAIQAFLVW